MSFLINDPKTGQFRVLVTPEQRFWAYTKKTNGCWEFEKREPINGYGRFSINNSPVFAHRFSWELHFGKIPKGKLICHHCDNPPCVRPDHLFIGTFRDNIMDCISKNRWNPRKGSSHPNAKLTENDIKEIRHLHATKSCTQKVIASRYHMSFKTIHKIIRGYIWKSVPM